jgi:hypothetical protein
MQIEKMHKTKFIQLCKNNNKKLSECMDYVVKKDGVIWHIDVSKISPQVVETTPALVVENTEETVTTTTETPYSPYTYSFYNRKYTKE